MKAVRNLLLAILLVLGLGACQKQDENAVAQEPAMQPIDTLMMSQDTIDARLAEIMNQFVLSLRQSVLKDTSILNTIGETQIIIQDLEKQDIEAAKQHLQTLIGKLEVALTKNPEASLIPIDVRYRKVEIVDNIDTVRAIVKTIKKAVDDGYYQVAKDLIGALTSEMVITTVFIPVVSYLDGLKAAAVLLDQNKPEEAMVLMQQVLSTIVITNVSIPLPILKAQIYIDEAASIDAKDHQHVEQVLNLLDNAEYQLRLAEEMGYGKRDAEFKELYKAIKELKKSVKGKQESQAKFKALSEKLKNFRERLFPIEK